MLLNDGVGNFTTGQVVDLGFVEVVNGAKLIDVDFDGRNDLAFRMTRRDVFGQVIGNSVACFLNRDSGFSRLAEMQFNEQFFDFDISDADADGNAEIITIASIPIGTESDYLIRYYPGTGFGTWDQPVEVGRVTNSGRIAFWDADKRNLKDILYVGQFGRPTTVYLSTGSIPIFAPTVYRNGAGNTFISFADVDRDGYDDLVSASEHGFYTVWRNDGNGGLAEQVSYLAGADIRSIAIGDLNNDKLPDIVLTSNRDKRTLIRLNQLSVNGNIRTSERFEYDSAFAQTTRYTDETNRTTLSIVDPTNGNTLEERVVFGAVGGNDDLVTTYTYNFLGLVTSMTDPEGRRTEYDYDAICQLIAIRYAVGTPEAASKTFAYDAAGNLISVTDELGRTTGYEYDPMGRLLKLDEPDPDGPGPKTHGVSTIAYDPNGNMIRQTNALGYSVIYTYDPMDRQVTKTNPDGGIYHFSFDGSGNVIRENDPRGFESLWGYDARNRVVSLTNSDGGAYRYQYDRDDNLIAMTDPLGRVDRNGYDARNRLVQSIDAAGQSQQWIYNAADDPVVIVTRDGQRTQMIYDDGGRLVQLIDNAGNATNYEFDRAGNNTAIIDRLGRRTSFAFDARDRLLTTTDANGGVTGNRYNDAGNLVSTVNTLGRATQMGYDEVNRLISITSAVGAIARFDYDAVDNLVSQTDPLGRVTTMSYDSMNRMLTRADALGNSNRAEYDLSGNTTATVDRLGRRTTYQYDSVDRMIRQTDPRGGVLSYGYDLVDNLVTTVDELDRTTRVDYDALDRPIVMTNALGGTVRSEYSPIGKVTASIDELGRRTVMRYDGLSRLFEMVDPAAGVTTFTLDAVGNQTSVRDPLGRTTQYEFDALNRVIRETDPLGNSTTHTYDSESNLRSVQDILGRLTQFKYDDVNRLISAIDPIGSEQTLRYDLADNVIESVDALGRSTAMEYDVLDRLKRSTDALGGKNEWTYDAVGNTTQTKDRLGRTSTFQYDVLDRPVSSVNPLGDAATQSYDAVGNVTAQVDEMGRRNEFVYDPLDRMIRSVDPLGNVTTQAYDATGNRSSMADPLGRVTRYQYDSLDRVVGMTDPLGGIYTNTYDAVGNTLSRVDPLLRATNYSFDALNRRTSIVDALGNTHRATFDAMDNVLTETDPLGRVVTHSYDNLDRVISTVDPAGGRTEFTYDRVGNVLSVKDAANNETKYTYDVLDRALQETNALGKALTFGYDAEGNLTSRTDRNGRTTSFVYDALNRRSAEKWLDGQNEALRTINYVYNKVGELLNTSDPDGTLSFEYDAGGRLTTASNAGTPNTTQVVWGYSYDAAGNLVSRSETREGLLKSTKAMTYDGLNRTMSITETGTTLAPKRVEYSFNAASELTSIDRFNSASGGTSTVNSKATYDDSRRLTSLVHSHNNSALANYSWQYDIASRITQASSPDGTASYEYDVQDQLTGADYSAQTDESYSYDVNGNRTMTGYVIGLNNRLLEDSNFRFEYDDQGNRTARVDKGTGQRDEYAWDYRNRLTSVVTSHTSSAVVSRVDFVYDPLDHRIAKQVDSDGDGPGAKTTEHSIYDGLELTLVLDDGGTVLRRYLHGPGIDSILAEENGAGIVLWTLADQVGTVRDLVDASGTVVNHRVFDSYGRMISQTNATFEHDFGFQGREMDRETGLIFFRARYYDPSTGQFISEDPVGFAAGDTNLRRFVGNSPQIGTDPLGLEEIVLRAQTAQMDNRVFLPKDGELKGSTSENAVANNFAQNTPKPKNQSSPNSEHKSNQKKKKQKNKVCKPNSGTDDARPRTRRKGGGGGGGSGSGPKSSGNNPSPAARFQLEANTFLTNLLHATEGVTDEVAKEMANKVILLGKLAQSAAQYTVGDFKGGRATFDKTGIPQTLQGIVSAFQNHEEAIEKVKKAIELKQQEIHESASRGDYKETGRHIGGVVYGIFEGLTKPGKAGRIVSLTPAQLKKLIPIAAVNKVERQVIQGVAKKYGLEIAIRSTDPLTAAVRKTATKFKLENKPESIKTKTTLGLLHDKQSKQWIVSDLDVSHIIKDGKLLSNSEGIKYLNEINRELAKQGVKAPFQHGSHATATKLLGGPLDLKDYGEIGGPGPATVFNGKGVKQLSAAEVDKVYEKYGYGSHPAWGDPTQIWIHDFQDAFKEIWF